MIWHIIQCVCCMKAIVLSFTGFLNCNWHEDEPSVFYNVRYFSTSFHSFSFALFLSSCESLLNLLKWFAGFLDWDRLSPPFKCKRWHNWMPRALWMHCRRQRRTASKRSVRMLNYKCTTHCSFGVFVLCLKLQKQKKMLLCILLLHISSHRRAVESIRIHDFNLQ